jgi:hypothetical protein
MQRWLKDPQLPTGSLPCKGYSYENANHIGERSMKNVTCSQSTFCLDSWLKSGGLSLNCCIPQKWEHEESLCYNSSKLLKIELLYDLAILLLDIYIHIYMQNNLNIVHQCSYGIIHNSQKVEALMNQWINNM